jgi:stearoyl-CoA desaturase (delta-9 desaturase)
VSSDVTSIYTDKKINWPITVVLSVLHIGAVAALFMFNWRALAVTVFLYWMATGLGISMGYHRLHTHRSYKLPLLLEYFLAFCATLTLEGGPIFLWRPIASTISSPTSRAIRIHPVTARGGRTWAGSWWANRNTATRN